MIRDVDLLSFLPEYMKEYRETKCLMMAEDPDVQKAEDATEDVKNNQFIQSCDIRWISMFERMVGILPDPLASIEERRRRVLEKWRAAAPYNYAGLIRQLNGLCWNEGYAIRPDFPEYKIEILVTLVEQGQIRDLEWICETYIPANMDVRITNKMKAYQSLTAEAGGVFSTCFFYDAEEV